MAYKIVTHRRGTTLEWENNDLLIDQLTPAEVEERRLIPEEGELVIEECLNGLYKCKIGDGVHKFSELPYITDASTLEFDAKLANLKDLLMQEIADNTDIIEKKLTEVETDANAAVSRLETAVTDDISKVNSSIQKISQDLDSLEQSVVNLVQPSIGSLDTKYSTKLQELANQHSTDIENIDNRIEVIKNDLTNQLDTKLEQHATIATESLEALSDSLQSDYGSRIIETKKYLEDLINTTDRKNDKALSTTREELVDMVDETTSSLTKKIITSESNLNTLITELRAKLNKVSSTVDLLKSQHIDNPGNSGDTSGSDSDTSTDNIPEDLIVQLYELQYSIEQLESKDVSLDNTIQDIRIELSDLFKSINSLKHQQTTNYDTFLDALNNFNDKLTKADFDIAEGMADSFESVDKNIQTLEENDLLLYSTVYTVKSELQNKIADAKTSLESSAEQLDFNLRNEINEAKSTLMREIEDNANTLTNNINKVSEHAANELDKLRKNHDSKIASNETALKNLKNSVTTKTSELSDSLNNLTADVTDNTLAIRQNKADIKALNTSTDLKFSSVRADMDILDTNIITQANRITNIIAGSPTEKTELSDIRSGYNGIQYDSAGDAVRAIGNNVQTLRNSLSQYIDTQAINGLHYDIDGEVGLKQPYTLYLTTNEEVIQESGVQIISAAGGGGGGGTTATSTLKLGYITPSHSIAIPSEAVTLYFTFSGTDSSGDPILRANASWKIDGVTVANGMVKDGENEFEITKYIKPGTTKILLVVTDDNGSVVTKTWNIQQIELDIVSSFNDKQKYPAGKKIIFSYTPTGAVTKTPKFIFDGQELTAESLGKDISGTEVPFELPAKEHGSYLLEAYLEADINGEVVPSKHIFKDILYYDASSELPIIGTSTQRLSVKQYSTTKIVYTVYDPKNEYPEVKIELDGEEIYTTTVKPNKAYNDTPTDVYPYVAATPGAHTLKIICGKTEKVVNIAVEDVGISLAPVTTGLAFDFNPVGKADGELWSHNDIHMTVSDNFDWVNGGYIPDDPDGPCFCIKAGSGAMIDYKLFEDNAKVTGKEFKLIFKTKNVSDPNAIFLSCLDNTTATDHIGLTMGVHNANIYGQNGNLELAYSEEDVIEFEFNISKNTEAVPMVMGYEDGVPSRPMVYDDTYSFKQNDAKYITLGSPDCDLYIYRFKVYNTSLSTANILQNFIADARSAEEMVDRYRRNQIYDENHKLTPDILAEKCPWIRVYKLSAPYFTNNKSDKVINTTIQQVYKGGDSVLDNWICYNAQHSGQGTSSNNYGASGRNLDFIMNSSGIDEVTPYFELGDGTVTDKITLTRESVPVAYLTAKVNIASSNNLTNAILANRYNKFNPYRRPFAPRDDVDLSYIKDTMEFHNCVVFIQETDPDLTTHREFADNDWHFYAIGNIGDSKKTDNTRATDPNDKYECCVEIMDVGLPLSDFPRDTMISVVSTNEETGERTSQWAKNENLDILYERIDGEYVKTSDQEVNLAKDYYVDILENDDFSEDYTYGWRYISNDEDPEVVDFCKQKWIEFYRFVTTASDEDFREKLSNYFVVDSALFYYLFTTRYCMVDNRAKNTFWHYSKTADGTRKWDLCWDYDNDTALGLNNYGKQVYRYGLEDIDRDESGEEVFRESDSTFFCRIRDLFADELKDMYKDLESKNAWHAESFLNACDDWQNEFPEELWRLDIERKYLRTYTSSFINGKGDAQFLTNMCNGRMKYHRRQWERNQEQYMASKYQTAKSSGDGYHVNLRVNRFNSNDNLVVKPNYQLTLTPFSYVYLNVWYGDDTRTPYTVRAVPNVPTPVPCPSALEADIINIGTASAIRDFGDLSACYPKTVSMGNASRVKKLVLGNNTSGYANNGFTTLTTGANPLLEELNVENVTSLTQSLDLQELINLKRLYAFGTNTTAALFAEGGKLEYAELPAINSIVLKNLNNLSSSNFKLASYNNVVGIFIDNCPLIDKVDLLNKCVNLKRVRLTNVDFGEVTFDYFKTKLFNLEGYSADGEETSDAWITGTAFFDKLTGEQYNELKRRYPYLIINFGELTSTVTFIYEDAAGDTQTVVETITTLNSEMGTISQERINELAMAPVRNENKAFTYTLVGWSTTEQISNGTEDSDDEEVLQETFEDAFTGTSLTGIAGNRVLYPVFRATRKTYPVHFINPTASANGGLLNTIMVPYGHEAKYSGSIPTKQDVASPGLYTFTCWITEPTTSNLLNITGETWCYAQFTILDANWYSVGLRDIEYTLDETYRTLSIRNYKNSFNSAIKIPATFDLTSGAYTVISVDGFNAATLQPMLEAVNLPESLFEIGNSAFQGCYKLNELSLPAKLQRIGSHAFRGCTRIKNLTIPDTVIDIGEAAFANCQYLTVINVDPANKKYKIAEGCNCLVDIENGILIQGLPGGRIPLDGSITALGKYCFANTNIISAEIPEQVSIVPENAFSSCASLTEVKLPSTMRILDATCFAWCSNLTNIELPNGLTDIRTYVFNSCAFENVVIPGSVNNILSNSFGAIKTLQKVTFERRLDAAGNVIIPNIHYKAFAGSGSESSPIIFEFPWTKAQHKETFGGTYSDYSGAIFDKSLAFGAVGNCKLKFADEETDINNV